MYERIWIIGIVLMMSIGPMSTDPVLNDLAFGDETTLGEKNSLKSFRVATLNASLYGKAAGQIRQRLSDPQDRQAQRIASIVQTIRPDVLLINELDYEPDSAPARLLAENYFAVSQSAPQSATDPASVVDLPPIEYPYWFSAPSNTGIDSKFDLNHDGQTGSASDTWGYGVYPGQYAMTVFSRFPIQTDQIRTFQQLRWSKMPGALRPTHPTTSVPYYDDATWSVLRLSSKNHVDVPIQIGARTLHLLASHPTPPVFDGPEDRNGARNHDEVEFWNHYLDGDAAEQDWLVDDDGTPGGLNLDADFVIAGDLNADPIDGSGLQQAIRKLLVHHRVRDVQPMCPAAAALGRTLRHHGRGELRSKTADFGRNGLMRVDFVIPSRGINVVDSGVFWPAEQDPTSDWIKATDHRIVWIEVQ
ncbi:endonuclease/exonuclease/phosphatase family protein [Stieleria sp. TO1_6]|uniref:endonuclease/exonuclease/phosphatase family protein n=1 Tax=Stieleria tagensis TaxID=2956795 RepID=UPI00209B538D|nr:endonuclease/exonuclease/phosphatase family protein [Stieleria tagensis]MCO8122467.1 endonuclease/exonuclease/phosphatase family protein [Stieleria tagensis]